MKDALDDAPGARAAYISTEMRIPENSDLLDDAKAGCSPLDSMDSMVE